MNETENFVKSSIGWLELVNYASAPIDVDATRRGIAFVAGTLKYYNGTTFVTISGSGGVSTWDELYDNDKTLSIDDGALTIQLLAGETSNALILAAQATATGAVLAFSNSGSGNDVTGTSVWSVSNAGVAIFATVTTATVVGSANLAIDATGTGTIGIGATSTGTVTITPALVAVASVTITGTADTNCFVLTAGDISIANGKIAITNDDTDAILTATAGSVTSGNVILITANGVTSGNILNLVTTASGFSGGQFIACNDGSVRFSVGVDGATIINSGVNSTVALSVAGIQTNENMVLFASNGVTATGKATVKITAAGATAAGSAVLLVNHTGTPAASTSYLAVFDYETATEATNDPITVEIRGGTSVGACLNVISKATSITGGIINITNAEMTSGVGINMAGMVALTTGVGISLAHTTSVIADTGSMVRITSSGINTGGNTNGTMLDIKSTGQIAGTEIRVDSINVTGTVMSIIGTGIMTTTGNLLTLTANAATTAAGLLRINANGITDGIGLVIASSCTTSTSTGRLLKVTHSGNASVSGVIAEVSSAAADETVVLKATASAALALGAVLQVSGAAVTTGTLIDVPGVAALTTGSALKIAHNTSVIEEGGCLVNIASSGINTGDTIATMLNIAGSGQLAGTQVKVTSIQTTGTVMNITSTGIMTTTGNLLTLTGNAATTAAGLLRVNANGLTSGIGVVIASSSTALTSGRLLNVAHSGNATATANCAIVEFSTAAADDTILFKLTASAAMAAGTVANISAVAMTTGWAFSVIDLDALTTGGAIYVKGNGADTTARSLVKIHNDNAAAVGAIPLEITQDSPATAHFYKIMKMNSNALWMGDGTTPNAALAATTGDILINGDSGKPYYCTNGAGSLWTTLV